MTTATIDPFAALDDGAYRDGVVEVRAVHGSRPRRVLRTVRTAHFDVVTSGSHVQVEHVIAPDEVDDDLAGLLATELFGPGWLRGPELFERIFTGVVLTSAADPLAGWELFYRNTLRRLDELLAPGRVSPAGDGVHATLADYAPVYGHVEALLARRDPTAPPVSVLEVGCCFGFLSLRLAAAGWPTVASDINPGSVALLARVAERLGVPLGTVAADAARVPYAPGCADVVLAVHLLEHLEPEHGDRVLAEALRLAARRVVVAVPLEDEADETWGHVRTVSLADLEAWGVASGWAFDVHEHHGGWLVLDRPLP
jgi:SAM-dependent methyltransferase